MMLSPLRKRHSELPSTSHGRTSAVAQSAIHGVGEARLGLGVVMGVALLPALHIEHRPS